MAVTHAELQFPDCEARATAPATGFPGTTRGRRKLTVSATHAARMYTPTRRARARTLGSPAGDRRRGLGQRRTMGATTALADDRLDGEHDFVLTAGGAHP